MAKVRGVVDPSSGGASHFGGFTYVRVRLCPHRDAEGALQDAPLLLWLPCITDDAVLAAKADLARAGSIIEAEIEAPERIPGIDFRPRAKNEYVLRRFESVEDDALGAKVVADTPAARVDDEVLGVLVFDERTRGYRARREGHELVVYLDGERDVSPHLVAARSLLDVERKLPSIVKAAAAKMYPIWNGTWRQPGERQQERGFAAKLSVTSITMSCEAPGRITVWLDDGNQFGGHSIEVRVEDGAVVSANLAG